MHSLKISEDLRPLSDMKGKPNEVVSQARKTGRPVVLTRYGKGVAVVLSIEAFEELQMAAAKLRLFSALQEAEASLKRGEVIAHKDMDKLLKKWENDETESDPLDPTRKK